MHAVPLVDLQRQYRSIEGELQRAVSRVLASGFYVLGPEVEGFEREFASFCGADHAVCVNSGTSALHLALLAAGIGPGDEVIAPAMTFVATVAAVHYTGATPVLVDVEPGTWTIDASRLAAAITPRTRAIIPVHLYGLLADMDAVREIGQRTGAVVIEDAAQAHGASDGSKRAGNLGEIGCFSFYPTKNLGAAGEGGALVTSNPDIARAARKLRDWGQERKYEHDLKGFNYRMEEVQAAVLRTKLPHVDRWTAQRRRHAATYERLLSDAPIGRPAASSGERHVYHIYAITMPRREKLRAQLAESGIGTAIHYPLPVHMTKAFADLGYGPGSFPVAERLAREQLSLPMFAELRDDEVSHVSAAVREFFR
jgi:dTDP-4-amino-4,6-dideoxygalactose transaminase